METVVLEHFSAGRREKMVGYVCFVPGLINRPWKWENMELNQLLEKASLSLGNLNSFARLVPNIDLFIQLHVSKESVISSRIEGTRTNIDEAFLPEEDISPERRHDWQEVQNYTKAMNQAIDQLKTLPISSRLLCGAHSQLLKNVRGEHKMPGEYRNSQNWIGGATLRDAIFIPPAQHYVPVLMGDLENFLHNETLQIPDLIRIGIAHYQFETIHPFLDGNGRIGRLLITLFLVSKGLLDKPLLYLSVFFEKNKSLYYDNLTRVREKNDLLHWLKYFLIGIEQTAKEAANTLAAVLDLKENIETTLRIQAGRRATGALTLLQHLFQHPIVRIKEVEAICNLSSKAANDLVSLFVELNILNEATGQMRNRIFVFDRYLNLFRLHEN